MPEIQAVIPSMVINVVGDLSLPLRFEWLDPSPVAVRPDRTTTLSLRLQVHNDNDAPARVLSKAVSGSNATVVADAVLNVADVPAEGSVVWTVDLTPVPTKTHGDTVTLSFDVRATTDPANVDAGGA